MKLVIVGEPPHGVTSYVRLLERLAERDPRVVMVGRQVGRELEQIAANAFAMVHPSRSEGLSVAVLEAMSYAKMVIMSDIPENLELVDHSGVAYPVGDTEALARAIAWAVSDPALVLARGKRARETVRKLYSWESVIDRTEALYALLKKR
jgi:glycosyltransferase involved in cell wall biosynthesis